MPISFEEAKKAWLAKVGNKSWAELSDERDAEMDAKAEKLMTPEYLAMWAEGEKELDDSDSE